MVLRCMLFNFIILGDFPAIFCYWFLIQSHCSLNNITQNMIPVLLNLLMCVLWPKICSVLLSSMWALEECVFCFCWKYFINVRSSWSISPYLFSDCMSYQWLMEANVKVFNYNIGFLYFFFQFCQFLPHIFDPLLLGKQTFSIPVS